MSSENHLNPPPTEIETVYTTVQSQPDRTDWLTMVSNLRQINRQLVEQIARLEQTLASSKQTLHTYKEEKQTNEIVILQQQDELRLSNERVGALFQQLETSHQIGQRQQILIETLSQQLEITQEILPQLEAENNDLRQKYHEQAQKLNKTEQVALELHRRMKHQSTNVPISPEPTKPEDLATSIVATLPTETTKHSSDIPSKENQETQLQPKLDFEIPAWTPTLVTPSRKIESSSQKGWREVIATSTKDGIYNAISEGISMAESPVESTDKESTESVQDIITKSPPNWPAPTLERRTGTDNYVPVKKTVIDLPKFPKKKQV